MTSRETTAPAGQQQPSGVGSVTDRGPRDANQDVEGDHSKSARIRAVGRRLLRRPEAGALAGTLTVYLFFAFAAHQNGFTSITGTAGWVNVSAELGIMSIPVAMLLIAGEFDLSIGSVVAATTITIGIATGHYGLSLPVAIAIAFGIALLVGVINGHAVTRTRLPSFIVTLATYLALSGITLTVSQGLTGTTVITTHGSGLPQTVFASTIDHFNVSVLWWLALLLVGTYVLTRRVFGNWILATGGEPAAANESGVPTGSVLRRLYIQTALAAALVGTIQTLEFNGGQVDQGQGFVFSTIIAAVIGGVLLGGGYGSALGASLGAMTYGIVQTGVYYTGWDPNLAQAILGGLLVVAVLSNNVLRRVAERG